MTRKEFILNSINKLITPILYLVLLLFEVSFLRNAYIDKVANERLLIYAAVIIIGILLALGLMSFRFSTIWKTVPENRKIIIKKINQVFGYLAIPFILYLIYLSWQKDKWITIILTIIFGIQYLTYRLKQTKQT